MAATLTADSQLTYYSFPITKTEEADDGSGDLIVWGKATDGTLDSDLQIVDPEWSAKALDEWYRTGANVRVQHQAQRDPAGKGIDIQPSPEGTWVKTRVVEPVAVKLVKNGVLQDYSVGIVNPDIRRGDPRFKHLDPMGKAVNGVITGREDGLSKIAELSLVDRGSNYGTKFSLVKAAADGTPEWVGKLTAPDDVLAKVAEPAKANGKTVTVELPKNMSLSVKPSDLAKLATFKQKLATQVKAPEPVVTKVTEPDAAKGIVGEHGPELVSPPDLDEFATPAVRAIKAAENAVYKRDIDTATRRRLAGEGRALPNLSYPIETHEDAGNAVTLALSGHGDVAAAKRLIRRIARKEGWQDILDRLKGRKDKAAKAADPDLGEEAAPDVTKPGKKAARKKRRAVRKALAPAVAKKKQKVICPNCGAKQSAGHEFCAECGHRLPAAAVQVKKNHDYVCLKCGHELDKGEKFCPHCGAENPGYNPMADHKIPANKAVKERVSKRKKAKGKKDGNPFGGKKAPPFGQDKDDDDDGGKPAKAEKRKGGKRRVPDAGVAGSREPATKPVPAHREPDGPAVEAFEHGAGLEEGDERQEMDAAMRHKALAARGMSREDALIHDLTCPAFRPEDVRKCFPYASLADIDGAAWQGRALMKAASAPVEDALAMRDLFRHAETLKNAPDDLLLDLRQQAHEAFLAANKVLTDATPGPASFPTPGHITPQQFRRPYLHEGHSAPSPMQEGPRSFHVPEGQPSADDYTRGFITEGRAADAPTNDTPRHEPVPAPQTPGKPSRVYYTNAMRDNVRQAMQVMHDHISRVFPDACPMSPQLSDIQKPAPQVPEGVGGPAPRSGKSRKAARAAARKQRKALARKRRRLERKVLKGSMSVNQARRKLGLKAKAARPAAVTKAAAAPAPPVTPALDPDVIKAVIAEANAPLLERIAAQDKALRKQAKALDAIASQPDTSQAPLRGVALTKSSAAPAVPQTATAAAERVQMAELQRLHYVSRSSPDPAMREAARRDLETKLGLDSVSTHT